MKIALSLFVLCFTLDAWSAPSFENPFEFGVQSPAKGQIGFTNFMVMPEFPQLDGRTAVAVRFYFSDVDFASVTPSSQYIELPVEVNPNETYFALPRVLLGNWTSGVRYYLKAALVDRNGAVLSFTPDTYVDPNENSIVVH